VLFKCGTGDWWIGIGVHWFFIQENLRSRARNLSGRKRGIQPGLLSRGGERIKRIKRTKKIRFSKWRISLFPFKKGWRWSGKNEGILEFWTVF
jgi:hypothetical protein